MGRSNKPRTRDQTRWLIRGRTYVFRKAITNTATGRQRTTECVLAAAEALSRQFSRMVDYAGTSV